MFDTVTITISALVVGCKVWTIVIPEMDVPDAGSIGGIFHPTCNRKNSTVVTPTLLISLIGGSRGVVLLQTSRIQGRDQESNVIREGSHTWVYWVGQIPFSFTSFHCLRGPNLRPHLSICVLPPESNQNLVVSTGIFQQRIHGPTTSRK